MPENDWIFDLLKQNRKCLLEKRKVKAEIQYAQ